MNSFTFTLALRRQVSSINNRCILLFVDNHLSLAFTISIKKLNHLTNISLNHLTGFIVLTAFRRRHFNHFNIRLRHSFCKCEHLKFLCFGFIVKFCNLFDQSINQVQFPINEGHFPEINNSLLNLLLSH